ncbi:efflux RND transporter periplasmic adaptor subunit [Vibrio comitans]|uniref:Multidrug resistance protein n=1 Tax=Vibrio comitans NBRC 102076 TaxID=1219078 RepID=A0A4Y3IIN0_9VIBR|nr:efflux RND transporter periplasmic adaptor subunit [Vibrio comitans]GEA58852.1 multidrug resistance protein [Vibrio comitans NBRC 102076]
MKTPSITLIIALSLISGCSKDDHMESSYSRPVKLHTIPANSNVNVREFPAFLDAGQKTIMSFRIPGQLDQIQVKSGDQVLKGETLALLKSDEHSLFVEQAQANYDLAKVQHQRAAKLRKGNIVSEQDFEEALATYLSAKSNLEQAKLNLSYTKLYAPFDGQISIIHVENHEYINQEQMVLNVQSTDLLKAEFYIPASVLHELNAGDISHPTLKLSAFPEQSFALHKLEIDSESDPSTNTYKATMTFPNPDTLNIMPGMSGNVELAMKSETLQLPEASYFQENGQTFVWKVTSSGQAKKVEIDVINSAQSLAFGLNEHDVIVASGVRDITEGMKVHQWVKERGL